MAVKKGKNPKHIEQEKKHSPDMEKKKVNVSDVFLDELKGAFTDFDSLSLAERKERYGDQKYVEQFWEYFKEKHPNMLDKIHKKDLPIYIQTLKDKGFTIAHLMDEDNNKQLHISFKPKDTEEHVMRTSLEHLKTFCDTSTNNLPLDIFQRFASFAGFDPNNFQIDSTKALKNIDYLAPTRKKFLEKEDISLSGIVAEQSEHILTPNYDPTERFMVTAAIRKISKTLKGGLKKAFDQYFTLPISFSSPYQNLLKFKVEWEQFCLDHAADIDKSLAKKLDNVIVTNGDIQEEIFNTGRKLDSTKGFEDREQYYRIVFNNLVTRQLFEEVQKLQESVDHYVGAMANTFKEFPPYINELLKIYPFNDKEVASVDTMFHNDIGALDAQIAEVEMKYANAPDEEKSALRKQRNALKHQREQRRWQAYIVFLKTKDASLAAIFDILVKNAFDFSLLSSKQQQLLVDTLVASKLEDTIQNKVPELLSVSANDVKSFVRDLFDLQNMELTIPTRYGPIPLLFDKKEFLSSGSTTTPNIHDLEKLKNLPLNFVANLGASNDKFFEDTMIFDSLYTDFSAKNGLFRINDAYKVRIRKGDKIAEGYLSPYSLLDERNTDEFDGKELYLYSEPITSPSQQRTLLNRKTASGNDSGEPVLIKDTEQQDCDIDILDKKLNLNGEALGALLFGYVLGQHSMNVQMSPEDEKRLEQKIGKLSIYKEKNELSPEESDEVIVKKPEETKEVTPYTKFLDEWKKIPGYDFPETDSRYKDNHGFVPGSRIFVPFDDSKLVPMHEGKAWLQMEIVKINEKAGTFAVKLYGGELGLGSIEGKTKELSLDPSSLDNIKESFGGDIYKLPDTKNISLSDHMDILTKGGLIKDPEKSFGDVTRDGNKFIFSSGTSMNAPVTHFGRYEPGIVNEELDRESTKNYSLYKIKHNSDNTITLSGDIVYDKEISSYSRTMDYPTFLIFVREKGLQAKSEDQAKDIKQKQDIVNRETPTTNRGFSINNIVSLFTGSFSKLQDAIKKYDEERAEELTDIVTSQGQLYGRIGKLFGPFARIGNSFENISVEYFSERDSRIWKKVEKWRKFYQDADFSIIYNNYIGPMLSGQKPIKPHYKAAAMLLAMIAKGKGPYNRNPEFAAQGMRVNILMGPAHQQRYLDMRQKLVRELEQGSSVYGSVWTDNKKNEILELEMKYIVHVMDGRQLGIQDNDKTKYYFYSKYSKTFIDELETGYTGFFSQSTVDDGFGKLKGASFDFARAEFFRLLGDRPQQAVPFLKVMATKAVSNSQRKIVESAIMAGMLSGVFLHMTMSDTQGMIQKISRTRGFVPGIRVKDIYQQTKLQRMLDIFSGGAFSSGTFGKKKKKYSANSFSYSNMSGDTRNFIPGFLDRLNVDSRLDKLSDFFKLTGRNVGGLKLLDIYADPKTLPADKILIQEFLDNSNEKYEGLENDVKDNPYAFTGSILTQSQSVVHQMLRIDQNGFAGKDGDEIQTMKAFFSGMANAIPKQKIDSKQQVAVFVDKFFNWFDEKGFSGNNVTVLIKRLKWCQQHPSHPGVDNVLYYSIVGQILESMNAGSVPIELENALLAWKDFFKYNLNTILQPDILIDNFGGLAFKQDYDIAKPKLEPRESCVNLLDKDLRQTFMYGLKGEERAERSRKSQRIRSEEYLNAPLYELAEKFERKFSKKNLFKASAVFDTSSKKPVSSPQKNTGAKIKNPEVIDKVKKILEGKPLEDPEDEFMMEEEYEYMD